MTSEDKLKVAAQEGDISGLYRLVQEDPRVLENVDYLPFAETPLHVVASVEVENLSVEHIQFAIEIMRLKPSFAWKLNPQGFTPIHLALEKGHTIMVLHILNINKDVVRVKGREGFTPLHFASQTGEMKLLTRILEACPESINDVTVRNETALHIAIKYQKLEALNFLIKWLESDTMNLEETILNWKDEDGNTILHIAAYVNDFRATKLLIKRVNSYVKNLAGKTAIDLLYLIDGDMRVELLKVGVIFKITRRFSSLVSSMNEWVVRKFRLRQHMSEEERNAYLVIATLVATAAYQAALSPPGGLYQTDGTHHTGIEGNSIMSNLNFILFSITNICCFASSTIAIFALMPRRNAAWLLLYSPTLFLQFSYLLAMSVISPTPVITFLIASIFALFDFVFFLWAWLSLYF